MDDPDRDLSNWARAIKLMGDGEPIGAADIERVLSADGLTAAPSPTPLLSEERIHISDNTECQHLHASADILRHG